MNRRNFIKTGLITSLPLSLPASAKALLKGLTRKVKLGIITDLHYDLIPDGMTRLQAFTAHVRRERVDAVLQMGDFAYPDAKNENVIREFNNSHRESLHVLGNHDTDNGHTKTQCFQQWGMPSAYYMKNISGINLIVLDGNEQGSAVYKGGYASYIGTQQIAWLKQELQQVRGPVIIISHQPLAGELAIDNAQEVQEILSAAADKILLCINGHTHVNSFLQVKGIHYLHINSASYFWVGENYKHTTYPRDLQASYPWINHICPYQEPLFSTLSIDPAKQTVNISGRTSSWMGQSPAELGYNGMLSLNRINEIAPLIGNRIITRI